MRNKLSNLILIIIIVLLSLFIVFFSINYLDTDKNIIKSGKVLNESNNNLALMLETTVSSGEYNVSADSVWPSSGYEFNPTLSKCENGSTLTYDIVTKKVKVQSNKSDKCYVYFDKEILPPVINSITESNVTENSITLTVNATPGTKPIKTYYYSKDNGTSFVTSTSNSYTFSGLSEGTAYNIKVKIEDSNGRFSQISSKTLNTTKGIFSEYLKNNNGTIGMDYHNSTLANGANDNSYRFSGANPNNYVCFGPGATAAGVACPEENQYRIIGVFGDQVKLIKKTILCVKVWNSSNVNTWIGSTMDTYLNGEYLNSLTSTWSNKIASNTWQIGGMTYDNGTALPSVTYYYEVNSNKNNTIFIGKIGLMYVSDYGFAAQSQAWSLKLGGYNDNVTDYSNPIAKANNWLFAKPTEWTISHYSEDSLNSFYVHGNGIVAHNGVTFSNNVRPVFYLESSVNLNGGNGTSIDPYRV